MILAAMPSEWAHWEQRAEHGAQPTLMSVTWAEHTPDDAPARLKPLQRLCHTTSPTALWHEQLLLTSLQESHTTCSTRFHSHCADF